MLENQKELILLQDLGMLLPTMTSKRKRHYGLYKCYCGKEFKALTSNITSNKTISCGCKFKEVMVKHNLSSHILYTTWRNMMNRCFNNKHKAYVNYGGRGITICDEWLNVENFINDMYPSYKSGLSIDRENNDLGYSKDNCRWTTKEVQTQNTRLIHKHNTSGYRGVSYRKNKNDYRSSITVNKKMIHLGLFKDSLEAAKAYDKYVIDNGLNNTINGVL
jgi:hypothetical protein